MKRRLNRKMIGWVLILFFVIVFINGFVLYKSIWGIAEEYPIYKIPPKNSDDTLRVVIIGDSWAYNHSVFKCDTLFELYAKKLTSRPVKCVSKGHNGQKTKGVYKDMFANRDVKYEWEREYCTQPLLEGHPDYCVVMAGINDLARQVPPKTYAGNYRLILQLLFSNGIRPVVMEIPDFDVKAACGMLGEYKYYCYRFLSLITRAGWNNLNYRKALLNMLKEEGFTDKIVFIPANSWCYSNTTNLYEADGLHLNLRGYQNLDSCIALQIVNHYNLK